VLPTASSCTTSLISSKKPKSLGGTVLNAFPLPSTNTVSGTCAGGAGRTWPSSSVPMLVPALPGA
jgi:hypothetical protein